MKTGIISALIVCLCSFSLSAQENIVANSEETSPFAEIKLFPNPTSEIIFIRNGSLIDSYKVIDMQGRTVQTGIGNAQVISLIDVPVGFYFIELKIGEAVDRIRIQKY